jgi:hypothetical protein
VTHETPRRQTAWLLGGFLLLIGIGVVTVLIPELQDQPDEQDQEDQQELELDAGAPSFEPDEARE